MLKRSVGDKVLINPYCEITGEILERKSENTNLKFDYKVKLFIPNANEDTIYMAAYDSVNNYWWNYFDESELDLLAQNYNLVREEGTNCA